MSARAFLSPRIRIVESASCTTTPMWLCSCKSRCAWATDIIAFANSFFLPASVKHCMDFLAALNACSGCLLWSCAVAMNWNICPAPAWSPSSPKDTTARSANCAASPYLPSCRSPSTASCNAAASPVLLPQPRKSSLAASAAFIAAPQPPCSSCARASTNSACPAPSISRKVLKKHSAVVADATAFSCSPFFKCTSAMPSSRGASRLLSTSRDLSPDVRTLANSSFASAMASSARPSSSMAFTIARTASAWPTVSPRLLNSANASVAALRASLPEPSWTQFPETPRRARGSCCSIEDMDALLLK
mmetsp:Transcript_54284/g.174045  ORF Transcript_54284/g.174045 Transcript_54284/m.174045 type:complete len:304 (-) Transcript_54284:19-930(-)